MQKKKYIKPEMEELQLNVTGALLQGSGEFEDEFASIIDATLNKQV